MGKHICIYCGKRRINVEVGVRYIAAPGQPPIAGFAHESCVKK